MKSNPIKLSALLAVVACVVVGFFACSDSKTESTADTTVNETGMPNDTIPPENNPNNTPQGDENDAAFMEKVANINLDEIKFGQLAQTKSSNKSVKDLGKMMEKEHKKAQEELTTLAKTKSATLPQAISAGMQKKYDDLNAMEAKDFDKEYTDMMVKGHKDAIDLFEKREKKTEDADLRAWVQKMLPGLRTHLEHAEMAEKNVRDSK